MNTSNKSKGEAMAFDSLESYKKSMHDEVVRLSKVSIRTQLQNEIAIFNNNYEASMSLTNNTKQ